MGVILISVMLVVSLFIIFTVRTRSQIVEILAASVTILSTLILLWLFYIYVLNAIAHKSSVIFGLIILAITVILAIIGFFVVVFLLFRNTAIVQTREGRSFTGKLSALLATNFLFLIALVIFYTQSNLSNILRGTFATIFWFDLLLTLMFFGYLANSVGLQFRHYNGSVDYIIVLGSWSGNGTIPPLLKSRVDAGINYYRDVKEKYGHSPKFVVSGGKGDDEIKSEAQVMAEYLLSLGINYEDIIVEDRAKNTFENFEYSKGLIEKDWSKIEEPKIIFTTSNYHVMRANGYAKRAGMHVVGVGAPTSLFFLPSALIREFIAIIFQSKYLFIIIFTLMYISFYFSFRSL